MKRIVPILVAMVACLVFAPSAMAKSPKQPGPGGGPPGGAPVFFVSGSVTAIDTDAGVLTVAVDHGSGGLSGTLSVNVTSDTEFYSLGNHKKTAITLADIAVGDKVAIFGTVDTSSGAAVYTALEVCVHVPSFACVGSVTAIDSDNGVLTVAIDPPPSDPGSKGHPPADPGAEISGTVSVNVTSDTEFYSLSNHKKTAITLADIAVGDKVAIFGTVDTSSGAAVYTALEVCVHVPSFACVGSVTAIDSDNGVLTVAVDHGSGGLSGTLSVNVTSDTEFYSLSNHKKTAITLADITAGDKVAIFGTVDASSGAAVYTASMVFDGGSAGCLPLPFCKPAPLKLKSGDAGKGDTLNFRIKVVDTMPGGGTAKVSLTVTTMKGKKLASATASGVTLNKTVSVSCKLKKALAKGTYRIVGDATDWAGNKQAKVATATLKVK